MSDLIDRQAAIEAVLHHGEIENDYTDLYHDGYCDGVYDSADILKELPSAEPKTGRWIKISPAGIYECSQCGQNVMTGDIEVYAYCHHCGAYMKEESNG